MYYNHVRQPNGAPALGINLEMQPPSTDISNFDPEPETETEHEPERLDILFNKIAHLFIFFTNCLFTFILPNLINILNLVFSGTVVYGILQKNMKYVYLHTIYLLMGLIMFIYVSIDTYIIYYSVYTILNIITIEQYS
jgi:hypothetical protein